MTREQADGDLISRQAVIDAIDKWVKSEGVLIALPVSEVTPLFDSIHKLPSVKPQEPKTGHWIKENPFLLSVCSECGNNAFGYHGFNETRTDYCPNCGCRMVEPQESEE